MDDFYKWFAWYPISVDGKPVFMKWVLRKDVLVHGRADGCSEDIYHPVYKKINSD